MKAHRISFLRRPTSTILVASLSVVALGVSVAGQVPVAPSGVLVAEAPDQTVPPRGPQATIVCPAGAVGIAPGTGIQAVVNAYPADTTFCLAAGVHDITSAITPRTGNTFVGEYGAILDGSGWTTTDVNQAAFRAHTQNIDNVTIRNLVIRNMPQKAVHATADAADGWAIEHNAIRANRTGVAAPNYALVRHNIISQNTVGGYSAYRAISPVFENNEIAYNGGEQKLVATTGAIFRNNFVHHNKTDGIWYDADNLDALIEGNLVEDNGRVGIFYEISGRGTIRHNVVRRSGDTAIFVSTSKDLEVYGNTLEDNFRGLQYFVNCDAVGGGTIGWDLSNNVAYENQTRVGTRAGSLANMLSHASLCTSTDVAPYLNGSKNNTFSRNSYTVPSSSSKYWVWGINQMKSWSEWQGLGQDTDGQMQ